MPFDICAGFAFYLYSKEVFADLSSIDNISMNLYVVESA